MIRELTFFNDLDDLQQLTGLTTDELWDHGANLDDWDYGFCCTEPLHKEIKEEDTDYYHESWETPEADGKFYRTYYDYGRDTPTAHLMDMAESYCCGWHHFEYNGIHYYT